MISLLTCKPAKFTVDNTAKQAVLSANGAADLIFTDGDGNTDLQARDHWSLLTVAAWIPYLFYTATVPLNVTIESDVGGSTKWPDIPQAGYFLYQENVAVDIKQFVHYDKAVDSKIIAGCAGQIGMVDAPAALNTDVLNIWLHIEIEHTLALI